MARIPPAVIDYQVRITTEREQALEDLVRAWEPRTACLQCSKRYRDDACGLSHALVSNLIWPGESLPLETKFEPALDTRGTRRNSIAAFHEPLPNWKR